MQGFVCTSAQQPIAHGTLSALNVASQEDWTMQRDISSHMTTKLTCLCYERIVKEDYGGFRVGCWVVVYKRGLDVCQVINED
jgi:hypothetical protein